MFLKSESPTLNRIMVYYAFSWRNFNQVSHTHCNLNIKLNYCELKNRKNQTDKNLRWTLEGEFWIDRFFINESWLYIKYSMLFFWTHLQVFLGHIFCCENFFFFSFILRSHSVDHFVYYVNSFMTEVPII